MTEALRTFSFPIGLALALLLGVGCSVPRFEITSPEGRKAILEQAEIELSSENCIGAIQLIEPLYDSQYTDNDVRLVRASAQACLAGMPNFFGFVTDLIAQADSFATGGLWKGLTSLMITKDMDLLDKRITGIGFSFDALFATIDSNAVVSMSNRLNADSYNMGSMLISDRTVDANTYTLFVAMAAVGNLQSRYGAPNENSFVRGQILGASETSALGWTYAGNITDDACLYATSVVTMFESMKELGDNMNPTLGTTFKTVASLYEAEIASACNAGCKGTTASTATHLVDYSVTGCSFTDDDCEGTTSRRCLTALRNRASCTGEVTNRASCAAAGIANFISNDPILGWLNSSASLSL